MTRLILILAVAAVTLPAAAGQTLLPHCERLERDHLIVQLERPEAEAIVQAFLQPRQGVASMRPFGPSDFRLIALQRPLADEAALVALSGELADEPGVSFVGPVYTDTSGYRRAPSRHVLVRFEAGVVGGEQVARMGASPGWRVVESTFGGLPDAHRVESAATLGFDTIEAVDRLSKRPGVRWAEPDWIAEMRKLDCPETPNDTLWGNCWGLLNTGQSGGTVDMDMDADEAWCVTFGQASVLVVVLDDGVQQNHPDIQQIAGQDFTGNGTNGGPGNACDNHGTAVAGCISATVDNSLGTVGVAPGCRVASAKFTNANVPCDGAGSFQVNWLVNAINWSTTIGARVTNNSNGFGFFQAISNAYANTRAAGVIHFASSGNDSTGTIGYPSSDASVEAVGAINRTGALAWFSNWGTGTFCVAPGDTIQTTDRTGNDGYNAGDYASVNGTSFSSPYAAGVAALVLSVDPSLTPGEIRTILASTARDLGASGYDTTFGNGLLNAVDAINAVGDVFVDASAPSGGNGSYNSPFKTVTAGYGALSPGETLVIRSGSYNETLTMSKNIRILTPTGLVTIN